MFTKRQFCLMCLPALCLLFSCSKKDDDSTPTPTAKDTSVIILVLQMGAQANIAYPNIFDVEFNRGFRINFYNTRKDSIDLVYYYDETGSEEYVMSSPNNSTLLTLSNYGGYINASVLPTANQTEFRMITAVTPSAFDTITSDITIEAFYTAAGTSSNRAANLAVNDIFGMLLESGKYAMAKVTYISSPATTSSGIDFTLKVQE